MDENAIISEAIKLYGEKNQLIVAIEELSELQKELCKRLRGDLSNIAHIAEEIADVQIMLAQLVQMLGITYTVEQYRYFKLMRLDTRIDAAKRGGEQHGHSSPKD